MSGCLNDLTDKNLQNKGQVIYRGASMREISLSDPSNLDLFLLPAFNTSHLYSTIEVRIPAEHLTFRDNLAVRCTSVWGTDVYTDDSDVVAGELSYCCYSVGFLRFGFNIHLCLCNLFQRSFILDFTSLLTRPALRPRLPSIILLPHTL